MNFLIIFTVLTIVNVIASTIKTIVTVNGGKFTASLASAMYYGYYNIVLIYTVADFPLYQKVIITTVCNLIGVYLVKWMEEKSQKDKLWLVKMTVKAKDFPNAWGDLSALPKSYYDLGGHFTIDCYCSTKADTEYAVNVCKKYNGKLFATASTMSI